MPNQTGVCLGVKLGRSAQNDRNWAGVSRGAELDRSGLQEQIDRSKPGGKSTWTRQVIVMALELSTLQRETQTSKVVRSKYTVSVCQTKGTVLSYSTVLLASR